MQWSWSLATVGLHALLLGTFLAQAARIQPQSAPRPVLQVELRSEPVEKSSNDAPAEAEAPLPSPLPMAMDTPPAQPPASLETAAPVSDMMPPVQPEEGFPLPPREAPYIPARELDVRPGAETAIVFPSHPQIRRTKGSAVMLLYIEVDGRVSRVEVQDGSTLPLVVEKGAVNTYLSARMRPGIKDGKPVKSIMKVQVDFQAK